jgi:hypothetical protein
MNSCPDFQFSCYPEGKIDKPQPPRVFRTEVEAYEPYFEEWKKRPEYRSRLKNK